jgi:hypothetical protein
MAACAILWKVHLSYQYSLKAVNPVVYYLIMLDFNNTGFIFSLPVYVLPDI